MKNMILMPFTPSIMVNYVVIILGKDNSNKNFFKTITLRPIYQISMPSIATPTHVLKAL